MANYTVAVGAVAVHDKQLAANVADKVTFTGQDLDVVEILSDGAAAIFVAFGAAAVPTVGGPNCYQIPAAAGSSVFRVHTSGDTVVHLISAGTPTYSVCRAD